MRVITIITALSAWALLTGGCSSDSYQSREKNFTIQFPEGWQVQENVMGFDAAGLEPMTSTSDQFSENVTVSSSDMPKPLTADEVLDSNIPAMIRVVTDFKPGERSSLKIGGVPAARLQFTQRQGSYNLTVALYALVARDRAYLIHCTAETAQFERFRPTCEKTVESFRISP